MASGDLDTRTLWRAKRAALVRLARFLGARPTFAKCDCHLCRGALVAVVQRGLIAKGKLGTSGSTGLESKLG